MSTLNTIIDNIELLLPNPTRRSTLEELKKAKSRQDLKQHPVWVPILLDDEGMEVEKSSEVRASAEAFAQETDKYVIPFPKVPFSQRNHHLPVVSRLNGLRHLFKVVEGSELPSIAPVGIIFLTEEEMNQFSLHMVHEPHFLKKGLEE